MQGQEVLQNFQAGSRCRGRIPCGVKRGGPKPEHSSSSGVEVKNSAAILHFPLNFHAVHWGFTFSLSYWLLFASGTGFEMNG